jgi:hypothetical protein
VSPAVLDIERGSVLGKNAEVFIQDPLVLVRVLASLVIRMLLLDFTLKNSKLLFPVLDQKWRHGGRILRSGGERPRVRE